MLQIFSTGTRAWSGKGEGQEEAKKELIEILKTLKGGLGDGTYFGGDDNLGFVDVALVPYTSWFYSYETSANFSIEAECPKLVAWAKRCMQIRCLKLTSSSSQNICLCLGTQAKIWSSYLHRLIREVYKLNWLTI